MELQMSDDAALKLRQEVSELLIGALDKEILPFYLSRGCPCAFPRFRALLEFDFRAHGVRATGCHESLTIIQRYLLGGQSCYTSPKPEAARCSICGSEFEAIYEDYSISFYLFHVRCSLDRSTPVGTPVVKPFPLVFGLYSVDPESPKKIDLFEPAGFDAAGVKRFTEYMMAVKA